MTSIINFDSTSVIDMGTIQEIANAVNRHDELLVSFTNSAADAVPETTDGTDIKRYYDPSSNAIMFGTYTLNIALSKGEATISFPANFASKPIVTATRAQVDSGKAPYFIQVSEVSTSSFKVEVERYDARVDGAKTYTGTLLVDWIAIGTKVQ